MQHALQDGRELGAHEAAGLGEEREEVLAQPGLLVVWYGAHVGGGFGDGPGAVDAVLEVDDSCEGGGV